MARGRIVAVLWLMPIARCGADGGTSHGDLCVRGSEPGSLSVAGAFGTSPTEIRALSGTATVTVDGDGLTFSFDDAGEEVTLQLFARALPIPSGEYGFALSYRPFAFAREASLELASSSEGTVLKAWHMVSGPLPGGPPVGLQYSEAPCENAPTDCYRSRALELTATASGVSITLGTNSGGTLDGWKVVNGSSFVFVGEPTCTDTNPQREGYIVRVR